MTLKEVTGGKIRINNRLDMDNSERFKNIAVGYSIQADRLVVFMKSLVTDERPDKKEKADKATATMKRIQKELLWLANIQPKYEKHLNNNIWCKGKMRKTALTLEQIIRDVDRIVGAANG